MVFEKTASIGSVRMLNGPVLQLEQEDLSKVGMFVLSMAVNASDAKELLDMLGIDPKVITRQKT